MQKSPSNTAGHVRITFEFPSSVWAGSIYVTGDFNNWSKTATPLKQDRDAVWRATVDLPVDHTYEFHYLVDGMPRNIYQAELLAGPHRSFNSVFRTTLASQAHKEHSDRYKTERRRASID